LDPKDLLENQENKECRDQTAKKAEVTTWTGLNELILNDK
jgi:hypothetical protein